MKILLSVMTVAAILFLSSCKEANEAPQGEKAVGSAATESGIRSAVVGEVIQATSYTYLRVKSGGDELWLAIPKRQVDVGAAITFSNPMLMSNFKSKDLQRTFESVYFLAGIGLQGQQPLEPAAEKKITGGTIASAGVHTVVVEEVFQATSYTYLKLKEDNVVFWAATAKRPVEVGETISFHEVIEMRNFKSKELQATFDIIYLISDITRGSDTEGSDTTAVPSKPAADEKIDVAPAEGGITIAQLFAGKNSYSGKIVRIRGKVVKYSKAIMGKNWVHLKDGTGEPGTDDLLVTTQEFVDLGDVVVFEGTIVLNKDFGAGYSYKVLMETGKLLTY